MSKLEFIANPTITESVLSLLDELGYGEDDFQIVVPSLVDAIHRSVPYESQKEAFQYAAERVEDPSLMDEDY